jgi:hypothetical protein
MRSIIPILVSFIAFSTGAAVVRRRLGFRFSSTVSPFEVLMLVFGVALVAMTGPRNVSFVYFVACGSAMGAFGATIAWLKRENRGSGGTREFEEFGSCSRTTLWQRWINFARSVADYEIRLVLVACYLFLIAPMALAFRAFGNSTSAADSSSSWLPRNNDASLHASRRSF